MTLQKTGFWAWLYTNFRLMCYDFLMIREWDRKRLVETDLCTFMRTILLWGPLVLLSQVSVLVFAVFALYEMGIAIWYSFLDVVITIGVVLLCFGGFAAAIFGAIGVVIATKKWSKTETAQLLSEYAAAKKSLICPSISIGDTK